MNKLEKSTVCKSCKAPITWCETKNGKKMPLDAFPIKAIQVVHGIGEVIDVYLPHWGKCPGADTFRKR